MRRTDSGKARAFPLSLIVFSGKFRPTLLSLGVMELDSVRMIKRMQLLKNSEVAGIEPGCIKSFKKIYGQ